MPDATPPQATVLVFGDLGRSPRMLNHARAMAESGIAVALVGYLDSEVDPAVAGNPLVRLHPIRTLRRCPESAPRLLFLAWTLVRLGWAQVQALWILLVSTPTPQALVAQNPPAVPTLFAARLASRLRGARYILDWHNFGFSMFALRMGGESVFVRLLRRHESAAGRRADHHLCVSQAMAAQLATGFKIDSARVLYDRPWQLEPPRSPAARLAVLADIFPGATPAALTLHCPTSWTDDEDVAMLLDAVRLFEAQSQAVLHVVITGQGPRRAEFESRLAAASFRRCRIHTAFLPPLDYRRLLGAADCGLSLHRSSSGVDLPMKLVDFFGAGTPALALDYGQCLAEQVRDGREALLFQDAQTLAQRMVDITDDERLDALRRNVRSNWNETWSEAWQRQALPLLELSK